MARRVRSFHAAELEQTIGAHNADAFWQWFASAGHGERGGDVEVWQLTSWLRLTPEWEVPERG